MNTVFVLGFLEELNKVMKPIEKFVHEHYDNPLMWLAIFVIGLFVFHFTYSALQKEK